MRKYTFPIIVLLTGCVSAPPDPSVPEYRTIPDAWLQPCDLPEKPENDASLSDAFVQAYLCGELGNSDKAKIRELTAESLQ